MFQQPKFNYRFHNDTNMPANANLQFKHCNVELKTFKLTNKQEYTYTKYKQMYIYQH